MTGIPIGSITADLFEVLKQQKRKQCVKKTLDIRCSIKDVIENFGKCKSIIH